MDHSILLYKLEIYYGITGTALGWFESYLKNRSYKVIVKDSFSDPQDLSFGVPQGSILGPILYSLYVKEIEDIANSFKVRIHVYADDVVLYSSCNEIDAFKECHNRIKTWTNQKFLKLNKIVSQLNVCLFK